MTQSWRCPYCNQNATIIPDNMSTDNHYFNSGNKLGNLALRTSVTVCPNSSCLETQITASLHRTTPSPNGGRRLGDALLRWQLKPDSMAKTFPDYIPAQILQDYQEACRIVALSPKASATLSRRCLQGMIRDFWKIKKKNLSLAIQALKVKTDPRTWRAIDAVRQLGNIGAHMEKNIDLIVDVDTDEASLLNGLIETLIEEWYVRSHETEQNMERIIGVAAEKKKKRAQPAPSGVTATLKPEPEPTGPPGAL
jgi:hypothetical protein